MFADGINWSEDHYRAIGLALEEYFNPGVDEPRLSELHYCTMTKRYYGTMLTNKVNFGDFSFTIDKATTNMLPLNLVFEEYYSRGDMLQIGKHDKRDNVTIFH